MSHVEAGSDPWMPCGLRPTLRHWMILVVHAALVSCLMGTILERWGAEGAWYATLAAALVTPWGLAVLVILLDRKGPLKFWLAPLLLVSFAPVVAVCYDGAAVYELAVRGTAPPLATALFVNLVFPGSFALFLRSAGPVPCPNCGRRALIPWMALHGQSRRFSRTRWCADCGAKYWRAPGGPWNPERRATTL